MYVNWHHRLACALLCATTLGAAWPSMAGARGLLPSQAETPLASNLPGRHHTGIWDANASAALLSWVSRTGDNMASPFMVIDKTAATATVYDRHGGKLGSAPVLIGLAIGDDSVPGIGSKRLKDILPMERTTPAGRFPSALGRNLTGGEILWIDYDGAVSMHPVVTHNAKERRAQRLASASPADNRISYGCVNVSAAFFSQWVAPAFRANGGIVYVLPEVRSLAQTFGIERLAEPILEAELGQ